MLVLFFFFKQKTAYELRISDWSSDVCSSDLSSASAERRFFMLVSPSTQRTASITLDLPQPFGPTTPVRFDGNGRCVGSTKDLNPASLMPESRKIGRASCRERGCQ